jgi:O-antigen ligase
LLSLPLLVLYVAAGSTSDAALFAPARLVASVVDSDVDSSTRWRDVENFNLVYNIGQKPMLGSGFGHEYHERWLLPDVSQGFAMYRYLPHNGVLGLWVSGGYFGFMAQWLLLVVGFFFAARTYRHARLSTDRVAALCSAAAIAIYMVGAFGDTVLGSWSGVFIVGPALAVSGKLAIATGAWPVGDHTHS